MKSGTSGDADSVSFAHESMFELPKLEQDNLPSNEELFRSGLPTVPTRRRRMSVPDHDDTPGFNIDSLLPAFARTRTF